MKKSKGWFLVNRYIGESEGYTTYPDVSGVYAIFLTNLDDNKRLLMYIGKADNLRLRLNAHEVRRFLLSITKLFPCINYSHVMIKCKVVNSDRHATFIEGALIRRLKPALNTMSKYKDTKHSFGKISGLWE